MLHFFTEGAMRPVCGARPRGKSTTPCLKCADLARCECGALIGTERALLRLTACIECARNAPRSRIAVHGDESTGRVWADATADADAVTTIAGRTIDPVAIPVKQRGARGVNGRFVAPLVLAGVETRTLSVFPHMERDSIDPTRMRRLDDWDLVAHAHEPIPGTATPQSSAAGFLRPRVRPGGALRANPWDRAPRDRGRRDFEAPTEAPAVRAWSEAHEQRQDARDALREVETLA